MALIETAGTLTIAAGDRYSTVLSQSSFGRYDVLGLFPPASASASAVMFAAPEYNSTASLIAWSAIYNESGANVVIPISGTVLIENFPYEMIRLSSSVTPTVDQVYIIKGQLMGAITNQAVLNG